MKKFFSNFFGQPGAGEEATNEKPDKAGSSKLERDADLLQEIRDNFDADTDAWREIKEQGAQDMRFLSGDPWDPKERQARNEAKRPIVSPDQLNQYVNQVINDIRLNKRAIKLVPLGNGASNDLAAFRADRIRAIEYRSDAQAAYITAGENCFQRSYGWARVTTARIAEDRLEQEVRIERIADPDSVLPDSGAKKLDLSDAQRCFVFESIRRREFKERWPHAEVQDFTTDHFNLAPQWFRDDNVQVAEYWRVEKKPDVLVQYDAGEQRPKTAYFSELNKKGATLDVPARALVFPATEDRPQQIARLLDHAPAFRKAIKQYMTNGVEILEVNPWLGKWIPIVPIFGKEMYVDFGMGSKRQLMSLIRLARDPQRLLAYIESCKAEAIGMVPKATWIGYEGQFEGHEEEFGNANKTPVAFLEVKAKLLDIPMDEPLPLPTRNPYDPPIQNLDLAAESAKRNIQNAVGMFNTSVGKNDSSVQSGVQLDKLNQVSDHGAFHFIDNYNRFVARVGQVVNDLEGRVEDTERDVVVQRPDEKFEMVRINTAQPYQHPESKQNVHYPVSTRAFDPEGPAENVGDFDVMVTVGPDESRQQEGINFTEQLASMPEVAPRILDLLTKMRLPGNPIGDEIAKRLTPPEFADPQDPVKLQAQIAQLTQQLQQIAQENETLHLERAGKQLELATRKEIENAKVQGNITEAHIRFITDIVKAELAEKSKADAAQAQRDATKELKILGFEQDRELTLHGSAHELAMRESEPEPVLPAQ